MLNLNSYVWTAAVLKVESPGEMGGPAMPRSILDMAVYWHQVRTELNIAGVSFECATGDSNAQPSLRTSGPQDFQQLF